jgi:hypothetical protein
MHPGFFRQLEHADIIEEPKGEVSN